MVVIINARREGYAPDQINRTMTVGELIDMLSQYDEDTKVMIGNDNDGRGFGWYTYGGIRDNDVCEMEDEDDD